MKLIVKIYLVLITSSAFAQNVDVVEKLKHKLYLEDSNSIFSNNWNNDKLFVYRDSTSNIDNDTTVIKLVDEIHGFAVPHEGKVSSKFGLRGYRMHSGTDIQAHTGDSIFAAFDGIVRYTGIYQGYGRIVAIRHFNGMETYYAHLSAIKCEKNDTVKAGNLIGFAGQSGRATGPHLHFETRFRNKAIDPEILFDFSKKELVSEYLVLMPTKSEHIIKENPNPEFYRIKSGDTLYSIARRNQTSVRQLCVWNNLTEKSILKIGNTIRIR